MDTQGAPDKVVIRGIQFDTRHTLLGPISFFGLRRGSPEVVSFLLLTFLHSPLLSDSGHRSQAQLPALWRRPLSPHTVTTSPSRLSLRRGLFVKFPWSGPVRWRFRTPFQSRKADLSGSHERLGIRAISERCTVGILSGFTKATVALGERGTSSTSGSFVKLTKYS